MEFSEDIEKSTPNSETLQAIEEAQDIIEGKVPAKSYTSIDEMFDDLLRDDEDDL